MTMTNFLKKPIEMKTSYIGVFYLWKRKPDHRACKWKKKEDKLSTLWIKHYPAISLVRLCSQSVNLLGKQGFVRGNKGFFGYVWLAVLTNIEYCWQTAQHLFFQAPVTIIKLTRLWRASFSKSKCTCSTKRPKAQASLVIQYLKLYITLK